MYSINPGEFKHRIVIKLKTSGKDADNIPCSLWKDILSTKSKITNTSGSEVIKDTESTSINNKKFVIRYPKHVQIDCDRTEQYRLIYNFKEYDITYMSNVQEANKYLEIVAKLVS